MLENFLQAWPLELVELENESDQMLGRFRNQLIVEGNGGELNSSQNGLRISALEGLVTMKKLEEKNAKSPDICLKPLHLTHEGLRSHVGISSSHLIEPLFVLDERSPPKITELDGSSVVRQNDVFGLEVSHDDSL